MYIDIVPNRNSEPTVLLRETHREGRRTIKRTIANLSACPPAAVEAFRRALKGERLVAAEGRLRIERSLAHGHVEAVLGMMRKLGFDKLLASEKSRQRDLVLGMIAQRVLGACSKLETTRAWTDTTLAAQLQLGGARVDELYDALDWLHKRQPRIEKKLARRHLGEGARVLFDVSSSSYHGHTCPLAQYGYNRDGEKLPSIVYGVLTNATGCPVAVHVYPGNTADPLTLPDQVEKLQQHFGLRHVTLVGDRGMLTQARIDELKNHPGISWLSSLPYQAVRDLAQRGAFQPELFDQYGLAETTDEAYPGERLIICYNPLLAEQRKRKRSELLAATQTELDKLVLQVRKRTREPEASATPLTLP
jgi:hypothetical protein